MKKQRTKRIVSFALACLMLLFLVLFTGCNSAEDPIDSKYTGTYTNGANGSRIEVGSQL